VPEANSSKFGAEHRKRSVEYHVASCLSKPPAAELIELSERVTIACHPETSDLAFLKVSRDTPVEGETKRYLQGWLPDRTPAHRMSRESE